MSYVGDFRLGDTLDIKFCTVTTTGAPTTLAGSPVVSAYVGNSTTQITAGITLTVDFDTVTGLHNVRVVATSGNGYATATNYQLVITTGTVGGTSVVGYVVAEFSIENRSALMPTTAARTLDVAAGGEAGVDFSNINGTLDAAEIGADAITAAKIADGAIDAATFAAGAITASAIAADAIGASELAADAVAEIADAVWDEDIVAAHGTADTAGLFLKDVEAAVDTEIAAILEDTGTTLDDFIDTEVAAIKAKTDSLTFTVANVLDANVLRINGDATAAARLEAVMDSVVTGAVNAGTPSTTSFVADGFTEATNDHFNGRLLTWTSGALVGQQTDITDYVGATQTFTVTAMTEAPADNDTFVIT